MSIFIVSKLPNSCFSDKDHCELVQVLIYIVFLSHLLIDFLQTVMESITHYATFKYKYLQKSLRSTAVKNCP